MEKELLLSVMPGVEQYSNKIEEVKNWIEQVLDMALIDFIMMSSVFKKYHQFAQQPVPHEVADRVSSSVKKLQYMDFLSQKLTHIVQLNHEIEKAAIHAHSNNTTIDQAGFIFKLNYMQATVAKTEFLLTTDALRQGLHDLHDHIISVTKLDFHEGAYFSHTGEIEERLECIIYTLNEMQKERCAETSSHVLNIEHQAQKLANAYTMKSERFVLTWLLRHPHTTATELIHQYMQEGIEQVEEEIDLF